jgi:hypothetical protein
MDSGWGTPRNSVQERGGTARKGAVIVQKEWYMKRRMIAAVFTALALSLYAQNVSDFEIQGNDDGTMTILNYKGMAKEIVIPEKIFNMPVSRLREGAFSGKGLTRVTIPKTVTFIGDNTFSDNRLTGVTIPEAVEYIGINAFDTNQLTGITLPEVLEYIGEGAFRNNQLTGVTIPAKVVTIGPGAFQRNRLTQVSIPDSVTYIGGSAFYENSLTTVSIGNRVVYIGASAFDGDGGNNRITTITLGSGIKYIGNDAFMYHRASSITIPEGVVYIGGRAFQPYTSNSVTRIRIGKYTKLGSNDYAAFADNGNFDVIYQNNDKRAGTYAYANGAWTYTP